MITSSADRLRRDTSYRYAASRDLRPPALDSYCPYSLRMSGMRDGDEGIHEESTRFFFSASNASPSASVRMPLRRHCCNCSIRRRNRCSSMKLREMIYMMNVCMIC
jgi:hypothetical protein